MARILSLILAACLCLLLLPTNVGVAGAEERIVLTIGDWDDATLPFEVPTTSDCKQSHSTCESFLSTEFGGQDRNRPPSDSFQACKNPLPKERAGLLRTDPVRNRIIRAWRRRSGSHRSWRQPPAG